MTDLCFAWSRHGHFTVLLEDHGPLFREPFTEDQFRDLLDTRDTIDFGEHIQLECDTKCLRITAWHEGNEYVGEVCTQALRNVLA